MTREEAIERLIDLGSIIISKNEEDKRYCHAIKLAIKALEQPDLTADQIFTMKEQEYCRGYEDGRKVERELRDDQSEVHYCDRDICLKNDYNGIGCRDCEVTKSQQSRR